MPVGVIMQFFKDHSGPHGLQVTPAVGSLELSASRSDSRVYLHVVNTDLHRSEALDLALDQTVIRSARVFEIAPGDVAAYVDHERPNPFTPVERSVEVKDNRVSWTFPAASVSVLELDIATDAIGQ